MGEAHIGDFALAELVGPDFRSDTPHLFTIAVKGGAAPEFVALNLAGRRVRYVRNGRHASGLLIYRRN